MCVVDGSIAQPGQSTRLLAFGKKGSWVGNDSRKVVLCCLRYLGVGGSNPPGAILVGVL
jgi:hypothetical protein